MIPYTTTGFSDPATVQFMQELRELIPIDSEAVVVFLEIHEEYHARKYVISRLSP
jgi:hypothetical protein